MRFKFISMILSMSIIFANANICSADSLSDRRMNAVTSYINNMLLYARYGENTKYPGIFADGINAETKAPVVWKLEGNEYNPSNFLGQQNFLRSLVGFSNLTEDDKYSQIASEQVDFWLENFTDENGLLYSGAHAFVDIKSGGIVTTGVHENKDYRPYIEFMYEAQPQKTIKYLEAFWNAHVLDWTNLAMSRHGDYGIQWGQLWDSEYTDTSYDFENIGNALAFQCTANELIHSAFFISEKTGDGRPVVWAKRMLQKYIDLRNPVTKLAGSQYAVLSTAKGGDRAQIQFGEDFGEIAYEYNMISASGLKSQLGYAPQVLLKYIETSGDPDTAYILDYLVESFEGFKTYLYNEEKNNMNTPMFSDGTSLMGYQFKNSGYYGNAGSVISSAGGAIDPLILRSAVYTHKLSNNQNVWNLARSIAAGFGLGDIGTAPGVNVNLNLQTTVLDTQSIFTMLDLYKATGHGDYLAIAARMGDQIVSRRYSRGMFVSTNRANASIDSAFALVLLNIEAAARGLYDTGVIDNNVGHAPIDLNYDGVGRVQDGTVIYLETYQSAEEINITKNNITIPQRHTVTESGSGEYAKTLRNIQTVGQFGGKISDSTMTKNEYIASLADMCGISSVDSFKAAAEQRINDTSFTNLLNANGSDLLTVENAAALAAGALLLKNKNEFSCSGFLTKFKDKNEVSAPIYNYVDIAAGCFLLAKRTDEFLRPKEIITAGEVAGILLNLCRYMDTEIYKLSAEILPDTTTDTMISWRSSNEGVVQVDENGRLFAVSEGMATITATCGSVSDTCVVNVQRAEDQMVRDVWINGVRLEDFSPFTTEYEYLTDMSLKSEITARAYSGDVSIISPKLVPGVGKISPAGDTNPYFIYFGLIDDKTIMNENFTKYDPETALVGLQMGHAMWKLHPNGHSTGGSPVVITKDPLDDNNRVIKVPYNDLLMEVTANFDSSPIATGASARDDNKLVIEYKLMATEAFPSSGFSVRLGNNESGVNTWAARVGYKPTSKNSFAAVNYANGQIFTDITPGEYHTVKMIFNKSNLNFDLYINDSLVGTNQPPITVTNRVNAFIFHIPQGLGLEAELYIDDLAIYEIPNEDAPLPVPEFENSEGAAVSFINESEEVTARAEISGDTDDVIVYTAVYSIDRQFKSVNVKKRPEKIEGTNMININIDSNGLERGDYIFLYVWDKTLRPLSNSGYIYIR